MKKIMALLMVVAMCLSLVACSGGNKKAAELSESAFNNIQQAYEKLDVIGNDILTAWKLGIYNKSDLRKWAGGFAYFISNISIPRDDLLDALASLEYKADGTSLDLDYYTKSVREHYDLYWDRLIERNPDIFSACIALVVESYMLNGELDEIETLLSFASESIKELSQNHSNYEHYENVKKYFTATNTYFNFCSNPSGTLEQAMENINNYNNTADECYNSLYYFFEE